MRKIKDKVQKTKAVIVKLCISFSLLIGVLMAGENPLKASGINLPNISPEEAGVIFNNIGISVINIIINSAGIYFFIMLILAALKLHGAEDPSDRSAAKKNLKWKAIIMLLIILSKGITIWLFNSLGFAPMIP